MDTGRTSARRLRLFLRDFRMVEATVGLAENQALALYFTHRRSYVNLREARWTATGETVTHAVLKVDQILWATAVDGDIPLTNASAAPRARLVEVQLDGGLLVQGGFFMSAQQRLSDYLETAGQFVPLLGAQLLRSGRPPRQVNLQLGDVVLNQQCVHAVWEVSDQHRAEPAAESFQLSEQIGVADREA
jgi:hypothetical protein